MKSSSRRLERAKDHVIQLATGVALHPVLRRVGWATTGRTDLVVSAAATTSVRADLTMPRHEVESSGEYVRRVPYDLPVQEQFLLELVNEHRIEAGAPPLAWSEPLADAAREHAQGLTAVGVLTHTGADGSTPVMRMRRAGFEFRGAWGGAENVAWMTASTSMSRAHDVRDLDRALQGSEKHVRNRLDPRFHSFGAGFHLGPMAAESSALLVAETYAYSGGGRFLTGVSFVDRNGDDRFQPGEELSGVLLVAAPANGGTSLRTVSRTSGGFELALTPGEWTVAALEHGATLASLNVTMADVNVKADLIGASDGQPQTLGEVRARADRFTLKLRYSKGTQAASSAPSPNAAPEQFGPPTFAPGEALNPTTTVEPLPTFAAGGEDCDGSEARAYLASITAPIAAIRSTWR